MDIYEAEKKFDTQLVKANHKTMAICFEDTPEYEGQCFSILTGIKNDYFKLELYLKENEFFVVKLEHYKENGEIVKKETSKEVIDYLVIKRKYDYKYKQTWRKNFFDRFIKVE